MAYDAFISYSHAADGRLAPALQRALHLFAKPWWKLRAVDVFRDETSLAAAHDLSDQIRSALESSRFFILLASPGAAQSRWVEREVQFWLDKKAAEHFLIVLTDGTIAWDEAAGDFDWTRTDALPPALRGAFRAEPLWVDLAWARSSEQISTRDPRFQQAIARIAARLHGKSLDAIAGEEVRQHRRTRRLVRAVASVLIVLTAAAAAGAWFGITGQRRAERNLEQTLIVVDQFIANVAREMRDLAGVSVTLRTHMLGLAGRTLENLGDQGESPAVKRSRAGMLTALAETHAAEGRYEEAQRWSAEATSTLESLRTADPSDVALRADLALALKVTGEVLDYRREFTAARDAFARSIELYGALIAEAPDHPERLQRGLYQYRALIRSGDIFHAAAEQPDPVCANRAACLREAQILFARAGEIATESSLRAPDNFDWQNSRLVAQERLGKVLEAAGQLADAEAAFLGSLRIAERLASAQPANTKWQENLMAMHWRVGGVNDVMCQFAESIAQYERAIEISRALHRADPERTDWARHLSRSLRHSARAHHLHGKPERAEAIYQESLRINLELIARRPEAEALKVGLNAEVADLQHVLAQLRDGSRQSCTVASR